MILDRGLRHTSGAATAGAAAGQNSDDPRQGTKTTVSGRVISCVEVRQNSDDPRQGTKTVTLADRFRSCGQLCTRQNSDDPRQGTKTVGGLTASAFDLGGRTAMILDRGLRHGALTSGATFKAVRQNSDDPRQGTKTGDAVTKLQTFQSAEQR